MRMFVDVNIKKVETLFGDDMRGIKRLVVCPINSIFEKFECERVSKGWWNVKFIGDTAIVKSPVASHVKDTVAFLDGLEEVLVIGFCGSVSDSMPGEIVTVNESFFNGLIIKAEPFEDFFSKRFYLSNNFCEQESEDFLLILKNNLVDCVDMETHYVFEEVSRRGIICRGIYVVTDHLVKAPFYESHDFFVDSILKMVEFVDGYIRNDDDDSNMLE